jgi:hypothetical protein
MLDSVRLRYRGAMPLLACLPCLFPAGAQADHPVPVSAKNRGATLVLSTGSGTPGDVVRIFGRRFPRRARVRITFGGRRILSVRTGRRGAFKRSFAVPGRSTGRYRLVARSGRTSVRIRFRIVSGAKPPMANPIGPGLGSSTEPVAPSGQSASPPSPVSPAPPAEPVKLVAAGDIACAPGEISYPCRDAETAGLVRSLAPDALATLGDAQYENGTLQEYLEVYDKTWGEFKPLTRPATGNHEYQGAPDAAGIFGHFAYFGEAAGEKGYYAYRLGDWHVFVLNSGAPRDGDCWPELCSVGSPQEKWLRSGLEKLPGNACVIAYWHHPRFSSGRNGFPRDQLEMQPVFDALYDHGAELALSGHMHNYERFAPMKADGTLDGGFGVRQFVVGTGGRNLFTGPGVRENSMFFRDTFFGVLELTLFPGRYEYRFLTEDGSVLDPGSGSCHGRPGG